jgi:Dyp-type peroxidase family
MSKAGQPGSTAILEPILDVNEIQGNILAGFNKDHQMLVALRLDNVDSARRWLRRILSSINTLEEVGHFNSVFRMQRARLGHDPMGLVATWISIAFSHPGLAALSSVAEAAGVPDDAFKEGVPERAAILGDVSPNGDSDPTAQWVIGGSRNVPDVLLIIASDDPAELARSFERVRPAVSDGARQPRVIWQEEGTTRKDLPGHEHFGFRDGISQPGVRGRVSSRDDDFLTPRLLASSSIGGMEFSAPGQPLVWPGQFVFGYPSTDGSSGSAVGSIPVPDLSPSWLRNGSLLVFRRLKQDVAGFNNFLEASAAKLAMIDGFAGISAEELGARIVGRWKSGAPLLRSPQADNQQLGDKAFANNDFFFAADTQRPDFKPGVGQGALQFVAASADPHGFVCPHAAHIRKVNPRDQDTDKGDRFDTLTRRIIRRGIPFGPPLRTPLADDGIERGLHFLCYQTSIIDQFEFLQTDWANSSGNPTAGGNDLIIGQIAGQARSLDLVRGTGQSATISMSQSFVSATGGGYFFAPSISAIREVLAR